MHSALSSLHAHQHQIHFLCVKLKAYSAIKVTQPFSFKLFPFALDSKIHMIHATQ